METPKLTLREGNRVVAVLEVDRLSVDRNRILWRAQNLRSATFYDEQDVAKALLGVLHESGHALYERGLPQAWARQPVGQAAGMAVHESQSLIIEMQACRSDAFLAFLGPELHAAFGGDPAPYAPENLARLWRREAVALWRSGPALDAEQTVRVVDSLRRAGMPEDAEATAQR